MKKGLGREKGTWDGRMENYHTGTYFFHFEPWVHYPPACGRSGAGLVWGRHCRRSAATVAGIFRRACTPDRTTDETSTSRTAARCSAVHNPTRRKHHDQSIPM